ncbi:pca operon transcription factor PcaQ [Halomonas urumqiensis]|uniref:Pca operon transcription factor PcaQ n=1 Tax=Halomonas urumqiensis TaxID=1684789 RepID=A0A2N7UJ60_9GAMM|nr:pca operon transcription factor PcaQ [Halomonas urumqiensis]PMR80473.1 pca operon transcription factor PcaQ [Halomonas urumqiensis]PTB01682.1 pca operon transcription factor PcaQ [Halomonas urumqiensis]GHE22226.1 pca operon transcription factor PcaQ [Halomonas urumqiensis]
MLNARIKLRHLQAFLEVARQHSFARAAEHLAITQPGMSKTIRELEETLGTVLFERTPRGVALTQAGLTLLRHAGPAIRALEEGVSAVGEAHVGSVWLRVGALSTVESWLLPEAIRRWQCSAQGEAGINVVGGPSAFLLSRLRRGELDLVVGRMTEAREIRDLAFEHLYYQRLLLVVRDGHPLAGVVPLAAERLQEFPWVLPPPQTTLRQQVDSFCVRHAITLPARQLETLSLPLSQQFTAHSEAIWVAPEEAVREALAEGRLRELSLPLERQGGSVGLCLNATLQPSLALAAFCETLREVASGVPEGVH